MLVPVVRRTTYPRIRCPAGQFFFGGGGQAILLHRRAYACRHAYARRLEIANFQYAEVACIQDTKDPPILHVILLKLGYMDMILRSMNAD